MKAGYNSEYTVGGPVDLEVIVDAIYKHPSDINEHVPTLLEYGQKCDHITEMGVRWIISTWVWLACAPKKLIAYDLFDPSEWGASIKDVYDTAEKYGLDFEFHEKDVLKVDIEETDLLFIDTEHVYSQLKQELKLHSSKVRKYRFFHDTTNFEFIGEDRQEGTGIWPAIEEFLEEKKDTWVLEKRFMNCSGLTIIKRIKND